MMISIRHSTCGQRQRGFTLLELMLSIGLLAVMMGGLYKIFDGWSERAVNRVAAGDMLRVQSAAEDYTLANYDVFSKDLTTTFQEIQIADLKAGNYLPASYNAQNAFRQRIRVFRRNTSVPRLNADGTTGANIVTIEVLTVSDNPSSGGVVRVLNKRLLDTAQAGGPKMGVVSQVVLQGGTFSGLITSPYHDWQIPRADLATYTASTDPDSGYLAVYGRVNAEATEPNSDWLYRVAIDDRPELNRMQTDLLMNGNRIENAGTVVADKVSVTGNATFRGLAQGASSETSQAMTVEQALRIDGTGDSRLNMRDTRTSGGCTFSNPDASGNRTISGTGCQIAGGEVQVIAQATPSGAAGNATLNVGTLSADGSVITDLASAGGGTTSDGVSTFEQVYGTNMNASGTVLAPTLNVSGATIKTQQLQTTNLTLTNGASVGSQLVTAQIDANGHNVSAPAMNLTNAAQLNGNIVTSGIDATTSSYIENVAPAGYHDSVLNRTIICHASTKPELAGKTYCEPSGSFTWANGVTENCYQFGDGYQCTYSRGGTQFGTCTFDRKTGASGQAYHESSC